MGRNRKNFTFKKNSKNEQKINLKKNFKRKTLFLDHITKKFTQELKLSMKQENQNIILKFPFHQEFMELLKKYVKGRKWEPTTKSWVIP